MLCPVQEAHSSPFCSEALLWRLRRHIGTQGVIKMTSGYRLHPAAERVPQERGREVPAERHPVHKRRCIRLHVAALEMQKQTHIFCLRCGSARHLYNGASDSELSLDCLQCNGQNSDLRRKSLGRKSCKLLVLDQFGWQPLHRRTLVLLAREACGGADLSSLAATVSDNDQRSAPSSNLAQQPFQAGDPVLVPRK